LAKSEVLIREPKLSQFAQSRAKLVDENYVPKSFKNMRENNPKGLIDVIGAVVGLDVQSRL